MMEAADKYLNQFCDYLTPVTEKAIDLLRDHTNLVSPKSKLALIGQGDNQLLRKVAPHFLGRTVILVATSYLFMTSSPLIATAALVAGAYVGMNTLKLAATVDAVKQELGSGLRAVAGLKLLSFAESIETTATKLQTQAANAWHRYFG